MGGINEDPEYVVLISGTLGVLNATVEFDSSNRNLEGVYISGTWAGTVSFEATVDGTNWFAVNTLNQSTLARVTSTTSNGTFLLVTAGFTKSRVKMTAYTSGTVSVADMGSDITSVVYALQSDNWYARLQDANGANIVLGQTTMSASVPVTFASNQSALAMSNFPTTVDTNYGTVGASTIRAAAQIGNATGAAAFNAGTTTAQTLRVVLPTDQSAIPAAQSGSWSVAATQSGTWTVQPGNTQNTTAWLVQDSSDGPVTPGAVASKSQLAGGQYNSSLPTLTTGQQSAIQLDSSGRLITAPQTITVGVADKTTFTYGTTTDLIVGGVYQDASPSLTAGQSGAVRLTTNRGVHSNLRDSSGNEITSANNGNANNTLIHVQTPDTTTTTSALGALNASISIAMAGLTSVGFQLAAGTLIGTITPQCSIDGGTTWATAAFYDTTNSTVTSSVTFGSANTLKVLSVLPIGGASHIRVIVTAYTSGTANALMRASQVTGVAGAITAAAFGTITNTYVALTASVATLILASNVNRKYAYISNPTSNNITIQMGTSTGLTGTNRGFAVPAQGVFELKGNNLFTGNVYAFTTSGSVTLSMAEGTP